VYLPFIADPLTASHWAQYMSEYEVALALAEPAAHSLNAAVIRSHHVYGPNSSLPSSHFLGPFSSIPLSAIIIRAILHNDTADPFYLAAEPSQYQDFLFVDDAARAIVRVLASMSKKLSFDDPIQLGSGIATNLSTIVDIVVYLTDKCLLKALSPVYQDPKERYQETGKVALLTNVKSLLGELHTETNIVQGVAKTFHWILDSMFKNKSLNSFHNEKELSNQLNCLSEEGISPSNISQFKTIETSVIQAIPQEVILPPPPGSLRNTLRKVRFFFIRLKPFQNLS
jgi:nucleoside-diphosphate-sugar epimerase